MKKKKTTEKSESDHLRCNTEWFHDGQNKIITVPRSIRFDETYIIVSGAYLRGRPGGTNLRGTFFLSNSTLSFK